MARDGFDGLGKMRGGERNSSYIPKPHGETKPHESTEEQEKSDGGSDQIHEVHDHGDGTFHTEHPDGTREEHPDHLLMLAHIGNKVTDGDKHIIFNHDGISAHSHSIDEAGNHEDHGEHNTAEEAKGALDKFFGEESEEPQHQHGGEENEEGPALGGM